MERTRARDACRQIEASRARMDAASAMRLFGLTRPCDGATLRTIRNNIMRLTHPDKNQGARLCNPATINEAFQVLKSHFGA